MESGRYKLLATVGIALFCVLALWISLQSGWFSTGSAPEPIAIPARDLEGTGTGDVEIEETAGSLLRDAVEDTEEPRMFDSPNDDLLRGTVVDPDNQPIRGAAVAVLRHDAEGFSLLDRDYNDSRQVLDRFGTEADGRFEFALPRFRPFEIRIEAEGFAPKVEPDVRSGQDRVIEMRPGAVLEGTVTRTGDHSPVAEALIKLFNGSFRDDTHTDAQGRFHFDNVLPGNLTVQVYPVADADLHPSPVQVEPGGVHRLVLQVEPGSVLRGEVTDALTGQPIAGAAVGEGWTMYQPVHTDDAGRYTMRGFSGQGTVQVVAVAKGYGRMENRIPDEIGAEVTMDFALTPSASARGRIVDADGDPIRGVYVAGMAYYQPGPVGGQMDWQSSRTGADGGFLLTELPHALVLRHPGFGTLAYDFPRTPEPNEVMDLGEFVLRPGATVSGRVVDPEGNGVREAYINLLGHNADRFRYVEGPREQYVPPEGHYLRTRETSTGPKGRFSIVDLSPGDYQLQVVHGKKERAKVDLQIEDWGQMLSGLEFVVDTGLSIRGLVFTPDLTPITEGFIDAIPEDGQRAGSGYFPGDGFEILGLESGRYTLSVMLIREYAEDWVSDRISGVEAGAQDVRLVVQRPAWIEGVVLDTDGEPVEGYSVQGRIRESFHPRTRGSVRTGADGRFRLRVGMGEVLDVSAGPPLVLEHAPPGMVMPPAAEQAVTVEGVIAGTNDVVIRLR